ncbi:AbiH family protein [Acinetobacter sp. Marseille-Q1618]|uniref:AbiH family protein n=1 Tax=Acinetobacter sp. Marseille-Q1618 TaxID=2697502 RepID=UPI00156DD454|nr:AbiH family protein [Acinetobacter sp. Marseille-Q1618]
MNILIVGNGFDLSHYLPTKYDHFMDVMKAIEEKDLGQPVANVFKNSVEDFPTLLMKFFEIKNALNEKSYEMSFDELFSKSREKWFIDKTKSMYSTNEIKLSFQQIFELQYKLKNNGWYQYFKNYVEEIKTWIDFEQKIEEVLTVLANCILEIEQVKRPSKLFEYFRYELEDGHRISERNFKVLSIFNFITLELFNLNLPLAGAISERSNLNPKFCHGEDLQNGLNPSSLLDYLQKQLEEFIEIFNLYLELVVCQLLPIETFSIDSKDWVYPDKIYSFNYTNTYQRLYDSVEIDYLHGSHGEEQNIVLGVSDLEDESLKKIKAYGFTKYHQKLFKDTDYLFLDGFKEKVKNHEKRLEEFERDYQLADKSDHRKLFGIGEKLNLKIFIWGHSLDISDKDYILDLFSLNDDVDRNVRVTVYYFNKTAKFDLLNNLLAILGKDKVEHWMKNKWLQFKENPKIVPESAITLEDLPKT